MLGGTAPKKLKAGIGVVFKTQQQGTLLGGITGNIPLLNHFMQYFIKHQA